MKTSLLTLMAVGATLAGCGAPNPPSMATATFAQDGTAASSLLGARDRGATARGSGQDGKPNQTFYNQQQLILSMQDPDASADLLDGGVPRQPASRVKFNVQGTEKLTEETAFITGGKLSFNDLTHGLHFQGKMDDTSEFISAYILYANLIGTLDNGLRFSLDLGQISASEVSYTFVVMEPGGATPRHQYTGIADKGNLKVMRK